MIFHFSNFLSIQIGPQCNTVWSDQIDGIWSLLSVAAVAVAAAVVVVAVAVAVSVSAAVVVVVVGYNLLRDRAPPRTPVKFTGFVVRNYTCSTDVCATRAPNEGPLVGCLRADYGVS